jgi:hypothetical protein
VDTKTPEAFCPEGAIIRLEGWNGLPFQPSLGLCKGDPERFTVPAIAGTLQDE